MCSSPSVPKAAPPQEPMKAAASRSLEASDAAAREQALRRGLASTFTRFDAPVTGANETIGG